MHARVAGLGAKAERQVLTLWRRSEAGELAVRRFVTVSALALAKANVEAVTLADLALTAAIAGQGGDTVPLGLLPDDREIDLERLGAAVTTVLEADIATVSTPQELAESRQVRLARLARAEPLGTSQDAMQRAMTERDVRGWVREAGASACELCRRWADGVVRLPSVRMARHTGCGCVQQPALS